MRRSSATEWLSWPSINTSTNRAVEDYLCGYIDRAGKVVIAPHFAKADGFHEGLAAVHIQ